VTAPETGPEAPRNPHHSDAQQRELVCAACHACILSASLFEGVCCVCGARICYKCWSTGRRACAVHGPDATPAAQPPPKPPSLLSWAPRPPFASPRPGPAVANALEGAATPGVFETLFHRHVMEALKHAGAWAGLKPRRVRKTLEWRFGLSAHRDAKQHLAERIEVRFRARRPWKRGLLSLVAASYGASALSPAVTTCGESPGGSDVAGALIRSLPEDSENAIVLLFSASGWRTDWPAPPRVVLISLDGQGHWQLRQALPDKTTAEWIESLFAHDATEELTARCVERVLAAPAHAFPLSAKRLGEECGASMNTAVEAFRRAAATRREWRLVEDSSRDDWLLDQY